MYFPDLYGSQDQKIHGFILIMIWILGFKRIRLGDIDYFPFLFPDRPDDLALCKNGVFTLIKQCIYKGSFATKDVHLASGLLDQIQ